MKSQQDVLNFITQYMSRETTETVTQTWFGSVKILDVADTFVTMLAPSEFVKNIIITRYAEKVKEALLELFGTSMDLIVVLEEAPATEHIPPSAVNRSEYSFDSFVIGDSNKFAAAAAHAVAENPGKAYNPLFIYGGSGLGKTHLLYAILNRIRERNRHFIIRDVTAEVFTNELAAAIRTNTTAVFRDKFRSADMILIDDIQFLGGKDFAQEEFFHTFNALHQSNHQLVVTSDRPPKDLPLMEERLRTRFETGLLVDIQPPDFVTRMAIVKSKALSINLSLSDDVIMYIAETITSNIRQLEGTVKKLLAYRDIFSNRLDLDDASRAISDLMRANPGLKPTPERIISLVCSFYGIDKHEVLGKSRQAEIVRARQVSMLLVRTLTDTSLAVMGSKYFSKDHSTIMYSIEKVEQLRKCDPRLDAEIKQIIENIKDA